MRDPRKNPTNRPPIPPFTGERATDGKDWFNDTMTFMQMRSVRIYETCSNGGPNRR